MRDNDPRDNPKAFLSEMFRLAVEQADPMAVVPPNLPPRPKGRLLVIGAGKASARMAEAVEAHYGPCEGLIITRYGYARPCTGIEIVEAGNPVPDAAGLHATLRMLDMLGDLQPEDLVLALISGGASALLCAPIDGVSLDDKMAINAALLASGAPISSMNLIRKHLSRTKGGQLAATCHPSRVIALAISDVPGDDPSSIGSGPTVGENGTPQLALDLLDRWNIDLPEHVRTSIMASSSVVARDDPRLSACGTQVIAAPSQSLAACVKTAADMGVSVEILGDSIEGEARDLGIEQAERATAIQDTLSESDSPVLLISGGECTVTRRGNGIGGPNAEFVLSAAIRLNGRDGIHVIACDTDGVDGAAEIAGAFAGPETLKLATDAGANPLNALNSNDAHSFFAACGGQIMTGPTLTNVNDFRAILITPARR